MKIKLITVCFLLIGLFTCRLSSQETRRSPASFDFDEKGMQFIAPDTSMKVMMRFRIQNSITLNTKSEEDFDIASSDLGVRRLRLRFGGFLYDPRLTFNLQLSFARGDLDYEDTQYPNIIRDAMAFWAFSKNFQIGVGQTKLPGNRQRIVSSGDLQFAERSIVNSKFTLDRDFGIQTSYSNTILGMNYNLRAAVSTGDGRYAPKMDGANFAYTGRVELLPFGKFTDGGDYYEGDLAYEQTPKLSLAAAYSDNKKSSRTRGQLGKKLYEPRDMTGAFADFVFKYKGFALYGEYANRRSKDPITRDQNGNIQYVYVGDGYLLQASYLFHNHIELAARLAIVAPQDKIYGLKDAEWNRNITLNSTYYLHSHRAKFQLEITHNTLENKQTSVISKNWLFRFNTEIGI
ncbi:MAG: OprO/OprP family phosphate-selective porin [Ignavibacteria bacterium]|nr:OprO/OprP family phosphate-selective porin [Ignavibacteria bacterium]